MAEDLRVLLLEDNPSDAKLLTLELQRAGFNPRCQRADTEESCVSHLSSDIDLILADSSLPQFSAARALDLLRERGLDIPLILVSGSLSDERAMEVMNRGAADYLLKDRLARLGQAVRRVLERKNMGRKAELAEANFHNVLDSLPDAILLIDHEGQIVQTNVQAEKTFGFGRPELVGQSIQLIVPGRFLDSFKSSRKSLSTGEFVPRQWSGRRKEGSDFPVEIRLSPIEADNGAAAVCIIRDISENQRLEKELRQAHRLETLGQLAGGVAHDFNNLLTVITGYTSILLQQLPSSSPIRSLVTEIHQAGERSTALTKQLLAFTRQRPVAPRRLSLGAVIADTEKMLKRLIGEDIDLHVAADDCLWPILADVGELEQVLLNLAVNARDAMPQGGTLKMEAKNAYRPGHDPSEFVLLTVSDTGAGMDAATKSRVFEPFFTTKGEKGSGLGLATVFRIVEQSQGDIEVQSEPGRGARFELYFPALIDGRSSGMA